MPDKARRYTQIAKAVYERPWAIQPAMLAVVEEIVSRRLAGAALSDDDIDARISAAQNGPRNGGQRAQGVAVIPIYGVIAPKSNLMSEMSGATTVESLMRDFRSAIGDPEIGAIVFDVDSPGGSVEGITEAANEIRAARGQKPMVAVANTLMASAAYWLASAADEIVASPSSEVGSIGIIAMHVDVSKQDEMIGEAYTFITAGEGKANGNEHEPLSDDARDQIQEGVDDYYALFSGDVAASRDVPKATISGEWQARMFTAKRARAAGLADRVDTLDSTVRRMIVKANTGRRTSGLAALGDIEISATEAIPELLATLPIHEQLALVNAEGERITAHYAKRAELRAKEGRSLSAETEEQVAALASLGTIASDPVDTDLETDQPAESDPPTAPEAVRPRMDFDAIEALVRGDYPVPASEVLPS